MQIICPNCNTQRASVENPLVLEVGTTLTCSGCGMVSLTIVADGCIAAFRSEPSRPAEHAPDPEKLKELDAVLDKANELVEEIREEAKSKTTKLSEADAELEEEQADEDAEEASEIAKAKKAKVKK